MDALTKAARRLQNARDRLSAAMHAAEAAALDAVETGTSEVVIARTLNVDRNVVRKWLGKPRRR